MTVELAKQVITAITRDLHKYIVAVVNLSSYQYYANGSAVLDLVYRYSALLFLTLFTLIQFNETKDPNGRIWCSTSVTGDEKSLETHILQYCMSYPINTKTGDVSLFYRWTGHIYFLICSYFYFLKKIIKNSSTDKFSNFLQGFHTSKTYESQMELAVDFYQKNKNNLNTYFYFHLVFHICSFFLIVFSFFIIDFCLQGKFIDLVPACWPFERDPIDFNDELSKRFNPFSHCSIDEKLRHHRVDEAVCHLTHMEYYEKYFTFTWVWLFLCSISVLLYICYISSIIAYKYIKYRMINKLNDVSVGQLFLCYKLNFVNPFHISDEAKKREINNHIV